MVVKYHKKTFENISAKKRQHILETAGAEFARKGLNGTSINTIAAAAGISIGAFYKYFKDKEDLYRTVLSEGLKALQDIVPPIIVSEGDIFAKIEEILRAIQVYARTHSEIIRIYLDSTTEAVSPLCREFSMLSESISAHYYRSLIAASKQSGIVAPHIDERYAAFCVDNMFMILLFSYASSYYHERMQYYLGEAVDDDEASIQGIMQFLRQALG